MRLSTLSAIIGGAGLLCASAMASAQSRTTFATSFLSDVEPDVEQVSGPRSGTLARAVLRPERVAVLETAVDPDVLDDLDNREEILTEPGALVFGSSSIPSLFCTMKTRRSNMCFRDFNGNGDFEQGIRASLDWNKTDALVFDDDETLTGIKFDRRRSISDPLRYRILDDADAPTIPAQLHWQVEGGFGRPEEGPTTVIVKVIPELSSYTRWRAVGECYMKVVLGDDPVTATYYGNTIHLLGFTDEDELRFRIEPAELPQSIGYINQRRLNWVEGEALRAQSRGETICPR